MHKSKLVRSLRILNPEEIKQLVHFLQSPYFNTNSNIVKLYRVLLPYYPDFDPPKLKKELVFKKLFSGRAYAHQQLLNLMSEFNGLLEKYLINLQLEKNKREQRKLLLQAYTERPNCYDVFEKKFIALNNSLDDLPFRDENYFQEKKDLNLLYYGHPDTRLHKKDRGSLEAAVENFEVYKKIATIKLKCAQNARTNTITDKEKIILDSIALLEKAPLFGLYEKLEVFQRTEKTIGFITLLAYFKSTVHLLPIDDKRNILKILLNYCGRKTNSGNDEFFSTTFDLYKLGLEYQCLLTFGKITETIFQNITTLGAICKEFDWTENFIMEYKELLDVKVKADALAISYGVLYFERKEYNAAIESLDHSFKEPKSIFKSKSLLIRCWFELWLEKSSYFDFLTNQLESFEKFTKRDKSLTSNLKEAFLKFIYFTKKILTSYFDKKNMEKIRRKINKESNLVLKKWLLKKIDQ